MIIAACPPIDQKLVSKGDYLLEQSPHVATGASSLGLLQSLLAAFRLVPLVRAGVLAFVHVVEVALRASICSPAASRAAALSADCCHFFHGC
jgi:hypothetical protein